MAPYMQYLDAGVRWRRESALLWFEGVDTSLLLCQNTDEVFKVNYIAGAVLHTYTICKSNGLHVSGT